MDEYGESVVPRTRLLGLGLSHGQTPPFAPKPCILWQPEEIPELRELMGSCSVTNVLGPLFRQKRSGQTELWI